METKMTGAKLLVDCLVKHGVEYIFGIPGAKIDAVFDALLDAKNKIKLIVCRHEQNAAFMAAMYGRLTGKPGVVLVTSGPGVSNLATGLLTATTEGDPVVALGANVPRDMHLKRSHQSANNEALMAPVTKSSVEVQLPETIPEVITNAFRTATRPQCGATFISFPQDVLLATTSITAPSPLSPILFGPAPVTLIKKTVDIITHAKQPLLFLGLQAATEANTKAIRDLLAHTPFAVISTYQAAGVVSRDLVDCFVGRVGLFMNQPGDELLKTADVIITIGFDPVEYDPEIWNTNSRNSIIHINPNPADIHMMYQPTVELIGDIAETLSQLATLMQPKNHIAQAKLIEKLQKKLKETMQSGAKFTGELIHPLRFIHDLNKCIDDQTTIISDIGSHYIWLARYLFSYEPHHLLFSNGQQTLGVALPWAIATTFVRPKTQIISISGDGGFLFSAMELETAVREQCHFVHCVWCDGSYDMVAEQQLMKYNRTNGVKFGQIDVVDFAESFGATGYTVKHANELLETLQKALHDAGPVLIEIPIDYRDNLALFEAVHEHIGS